MVFYCATTNIPRLRRFAGESQRKSLQKSFRWRLERRAPPRLVGKIHHLTPRRCSALQFCRGLDMRFTRRAARRRVRKSDIVNSIGHNLQFFGQRVCLGRNFDRTLKSHESGTPITVSAWTARLRQPGRNGVRRSGGGVKLYPPIG